MCMFYSLLPLFLPLPLLHHLPPTLSPLPFPLSSSSFGFLSPLSACFQSILHSALRTFLHACLSPFSRVWLFVTPWTIAHQPPPSAEFSRQEYWSGLSCPLPGDFLNPGIEPTSLGSSALADGFFTTGATWEAPGCFWSKTPQVISLVNLSRSKACHPGVHDPILPDLYSCCRPPCLLPVLQPSSAACTFPVSKLSLSGPLHVLVPLPG